LNAARVTFSVISAIAIRYETSISVSSPDNFRVSNSCTAATDLAVCPSTIANANACLERK
jgi:hypothetical protein